MRQDNLKFVVSEEEVGLRLDKFLVAQLSDFSRSEIQKFNVSVNGSAEKFSQRLKLGDIVVVDIPERKTDIAAENISSDFDLDILYEDEDYHTENLEFVDLSAL